MDIRDIKIEDFNEYYKGTNNTPVLTQIFNLQKKLLDAYIGIEKLPPYPVDINSPINQILIKDFIARVTEELGEAHESYIWLCDSSSHPDGNDPEVLHKVYNFNEEIADSIHFITELCIYSGISEDQVIGGEGLYYGIKKASNITYQSYPHDIIRSIRIPNQTLFTQGGTNISPNLKAYQALDMWVVTYCLQLARNSLKNKPWKQTQMLSDKRVYTHNVIQAYRALLDLAHYSGITYMGFLAIYWAKNQINWFRIKSKY